MTHYQCTLLCVGLFRHHYPVGMTAGGTCILCSTTSTSLTGNHGYGHVTMATYSKRSMNEM